MRQHLRDISANAARAQILNAFLLKLNTARCKILKRNHFKGNLHQRQTSILERKLNFLGIFLTFLDCLSMGNWDFPPGNYLQAFAKSNLMLDYIYSLKPRRSLIHFDIFCYFNPTVIFLTLLHLFFMKINFTENIRNATITINLSISIQKKTRTS